MRGTIILAMFFLAAGCLMQPYSEENDTQQTTASTNLTNPPVPPSSPVSDCGGPVCGADNRTYPTDCDAGIAGVSISYSGECIVEGNCSDTDTGVDPAAAGSVSKGNDTNSDYCTDALQLIEYSCSNNSIMQTAISCGAGNECRGGQCVPASHSNATGNQSAGCEGPASANIYIREGATYNGSSYPDICIDFSTVKDFYCSGERLDSVNQECPAGYGCSGGICTPYGYSCSETDGGNDTLVRGKTTMVYGLLTTFENWDECIDDGLIIEYYCHVNGSSVSQEILCPSGRKCDNGRCIRSACSETDGGKNIYDAGTTTVGSTESRDRCESSDSVQEYFCYGDVARGDIIPCGSGYVCEGNECVRD